MPELQFEVIHQDNKTRARLGIITTLHGNIQTPAFVPVGTQATVKSVTPEELETLGTQLFFVNTYHVYLRPGIDVIKKFGGLHKFMNWNRPLITDSGGFQVFSLGEKRYVNIAISESAVLDRERFTQKMSKQDASDKQVFPDDYRPVGELVKIDEEGVTFTSHWDGSTHRFSPAVSIDLQHKLSADIMIAFDECPPYPTSHSYALEAMNRTHQWAHESLRAHRKGQTSKKSKAKSQALYGVVQGSVYQDLREESARVIGGMGFDGIAIGGVAVGESKEEMTKVLQRVCPLLPEGKPRHLLGVGEIDDIFSIVENGVDTFDCVGPTRLARMGQLFTTDRSAGSHRWTIDITKVRHAREVNSIEESCLCYTCQHFSRAYIHHLFRVRELLGYRLATIHNIYFVMQLVREIRKNIEEGTFLEMKQRWL